ncbi:MAG: acetylglutamate kinase [Eubacteriales bacterium]
MEKYIEKAGILIEALPYIQQLQGKTVVIKYGGSAMLSETLTEKILQDIILLKFVGMKPVVVHGGGNDINKMLDKLAIEPKFVDGLRVTDEATMDVVQMVLTGKINKNIVSNLCTLGGKAIGLCGKDANLITAKKLEGANGVDYGFVGEVTSINTKLLEVLTSDVYIPVIAPIGTDEKGNTYNINADTVAGEIAIAMQAEKLIFLTDTDGIRRNPEDPDSLIHIIEEKEITEMIKNEQIVGGMLPKVAGCIRALDSGVNRTHILNGTIEHPIILEIFTDSGIGTMVHK